MKADKEAEGVLAESHEKDQKPRRQKGHTHMVRLDPESAEEIKEIVILGNSRRTQSPTHANETSSRSHAVLQVHVSQSPRTASTTEQRSLATLSIIDLAGSERAAATTNMGKRMVEGANINKSLLALGNCINALCESAGATRHVPYRNSKLTRLLKFSLGGNCKTVMIVCVAPASNHFDDTHNTLLYADRASKIKTKVVTRNVVNVERHVGQYVEAINRLNLEVAELKARLADRVSGETVNSRQDRDEASLELEQTKEDMRLKASQALPAIIGSVEPESKLTIASIKKKVLDSRLVELRRSSQSEASSEAIAEHTLLSNLITIHAATLEPSSDLHARLAHSRNATSMFEAVLRAISEKRSNKLGKADMAILQLEAQYHRSELSRKKTEAMLEALKDAFSGQVDLTARALGVLARFTVTLKDEGDSLRKTDLESTVLADTVNKVALSLEKLAESGDMACRTLVGPSCSGEVSTQLPVGNGLISASSLSANTIQTRSTVQPEIRRHTRSGVNISRTPSRKSHRTPRKSLRSSIVTTLANNRRNLPDKVPEKKKGVQWRDQVGKGNLDDRSFGSCSSTSMILRPTSPPISEGDWEDDKQEESSTSGSLATARSESASVAPRRLNRLDPLFLKARSNVPSLGTLPEKEESAAGETTNTNKPFSDRSNRSHTPSETSQETPESIQLGKGKGREIHTALKVPGSTGKRRRSNIGPVRSEKVRRRSSLLPSPGFDRGREVENMSELTKSGLHRNSHIRTPSKRSRRLSSLGSVTRSIPPVRPSLLNRGILPQTEANTSNDSYSRPPKPSWR